MLVGLTVSLTVGCAVTPDGRIIYPVVQVYEQPISPPPPPPAIISVGVITPEAYVWNGYEYIGWYGDRYVYLSPTGWLICDEVRLRRFHEWRSRNPRYREKATRYRGRGNDHDDHGR